MSTDLINHLPFPICQVYLRARNAKSVSDRHNNAYYLFESALRTTAALGIKVYLEEGRPDEKVDKALQALGQPSVGQWAGIVRELSRYFSKGGAAGSDRLAEWGRLYSERSKNLPRCATLARSISEQDEVDLGFGEKLSPVDVYNFLPAYRNRHLGHGAMASEAFFQRFGILLMEAAEELLVMVDPMAGGELCLAEEKREVGGGEVAVEMIRLTGGMPLREAPAHGPQAAMEKWTAGQLYATWKDRDPVPLSPLLHCSHSDERTEVTFYNKRAGAAGAEFLNYFTGESKKVQLQPEEFAFIDESAIDPAERRKRAKPSGDQRGQTADQSPSKGRAWRRSVAVMGFKNLVGKPEMAWLSTALSELIGTELAVGGQVRTVPGENVARMKIDLSLPESDSFSRETLSRIRANLGCDFVVLGSYIAMGEKSGGQIRLDIRVQDAAAGATTATISENGTEQDFIEFVARAGTSLRETFGAKALTAAQEMQVKATLPSGIGAVKLYAEGLERLRRYDALGARDLLEKVVAAEPGHSLAHSALASAWAMLGYDERAKESAKTAFGLAGNLPREEGLLVEGRFRQAGREWARADEIYRTLFNFFPDNLEFGLRLGEVQIWAGKGREAAATLASLRELPPPAAEDPRIDLAEAQLGHATSDLNSMRLAASRAAEKAQALGAGTLVARAKFTESYALGLQGELDRAIDSACLASDLFSKAGDLSGSAEAMNAMALNRWRKGDLSGARELYQEAREVFKGIGKKQGVASTTHNLAMVLYSIGDIAGARGRTEEVLEIWRELGNRPCEADALNNIGSFYIDEGNFPAAREAFEKCLALYREMGNKLSEANTLNNMGIILSEEGHYRQAVENHRLARGYFELAGNREGVASSLANLSIALLGLGNLREAAAAAKEEADLCRGIGHRTSVAYALNYLGNALLHSGDTDGAREAYSESLAIRTELEEAKEIAQVRSDLANLSLREGDLARAAELAAQASEGFHAAGAPEEQATADCIRAEALLALGRGDEASTLLEKAQRTLLTLDHPHFRMLVTLTAAKIQASQGDRNRTEAAAAVVEARLAELSDRIPLFQRFDTRLALAQMHMASGERDEAAASIESVRADALSSGHGLAARVAEKLLGRT